MLAAVDTQQSDCGERTLNGNINGAAEYFQHCHFTSVTHLQAVGLILQLLSMAKHARCSNDSTN